MPTIAGANYLYQLRNSTTASATISGYPLTASGNTSHLSDHQYITYLLESHDNILSSASLLANNGLASDATGYVSGAKLVFSSAPALTSSSLTANNVPVNFGAWVPYVPSISGFSGVSSSVARYNQIGKTVHFETTYALGTAVYSAGNWAIGLPTAMNSSYANGYQTNVKVIYGQSGTIQLGSGIMSSGSVVLYTAGTGAAVLTSSAAPFAGWNSASIIVSGTYEAL
jgi:hypothetical protein